MLCRKCYFLKIDFTFLAFESWLEFKHTLVVKADCRFLYSNQI